MKILLERFVKSFNKAINAEMQAMRQRMGPFEVPLNNPRLLIDHASTFHKTASSKEAVSEAVTDKIYQFDISQPNDKLMLQAECTLVYPDTEILTTITGIEKDYLTLKCRDHIPLDAIAYRLVIYPWFLYEKLQLALKALQGTAHTAPFYIANAFMLFGKGGVRQDQRTLLNSHAALNPSQNQAVQLCLNSNLAFVWGPPGTGKTTTLGHIVTELLAHNYRILLTSTTNAAVDQALAKLATLDSASTFFQAGQVLRLGQTNTETFGTSLDQVVRQLHEKTQTQLKKLRSRQLALRRQLQGCEALLTKFEVERQPLQLNLFQDTTPEVVTHHELSLVFSSKLTQKIRAWSVKDQQQAVLRRQTRLQTCLRLTEEKVSQLVNYLQGQEQPVVQQAQVVLATMTNVYLSSLLQEERFDVVIVEEAGMAILPTIFYCATLAAEKVIVVGDPKQLLPIVQSRDDYVRRAMGRNIFDVTVPKPDESDIVVMLNMQYRMHPQIGDLVSQMFYQGKLHNHQSTLKRKAITDKQPYPGHPLVVCDTHGQTVCTTQAGSYSRFNQQTAQLCVDLALEATQAALISVAIITPYAEQSRLIRRLLAQTPRNTGQIECQTIHRFQGSERDLVILDTVDTIPLAPGVLLADQSPLSSAKNLINVSISRARGKLIIISDIAYFQQRAPQSVVSDMLIRVAQTGLLAASSL